MRLCLSMITIRLKLFQMITIRELMDRLSILSLSSAQKNKRGGLCGIDRAGKDGAQRSGHGCVTPSKHSGHPVDVLHILCRCEHSLPLPIKQKTKNKKRTQTRNCPPENSKFPTPKNYIKNIWNGYYPKLKKAEEDNMKLIVLTHHSPTNYKCVAEEDDLNSSGHGKYGPPKNSFFPSSISQPPVFA